jgi:hypothetical protein
MSRRRGHAARLSSVPLAAGVAGVLLFAALATPALAVTPDLTFGINYEQGPYLGNEDVGLGELYLLTEAGSPSGRISLRIPYTRIDRTGLVTYAADGPIILGAGGPGKPLWQESEADTSEADLGDLLLRYEIPLARAGGGNKPAFTFYLDYKYGMADEKKGLGTGESDWGGGLDYTQPLGKVLQFMVSGSYQFMGSPDVPLTALSITKVEFKDRLRILAGFGLVTSKFNWRLVGESVSPVLDQVPIFDAAGVPIPGIAAEVEDYRVVRGEMVYRSKAGGSTRLYVLTGLNDSSPDIGFGLSFSSRGQ